MAPKKLHWVRSEGKRKEISDQQLHYKMNFLPSIRVTFVVLSTISTIPKHKEASEAVDVVKE